ncbi:MAG: hypothetical protein JNL67_01010 [Planctomycetaceae bacterium]|nr:hypothetical protein [Planctomycetaceae bacterium]
MPLCTDVRLLKSCNPKFPNRCIACSGPSPDSSIGVGDLSVGWFSFLTDIPEGWSSVNVPIHSVCKRPFRLRRWATRLGYLALAFVLWWFLGESIVAILPKGLERIGTKVILVLMLAPVIIIEMFRPPRFDITVGKYEVTFEFADPDYAAAFAVLNRAGLLK